MTQILQVFATLELSLLFICGGALILSVALKKPWTDQAVWLYYAWWGTVLMMVLFVLSVVINGHVNISIK